MNEESREKVELTEDILGDFGFRVRWRYEPYWCDVEVWHVVMRTMDGVPEFQRKGSAWGPNGVPDIADAERYLQGHIKWDGCSEFSFGPDEEHGNDFHWCGPHDYKQHFALLEALYKRSRELMTHGREYGWDD